MPGDFAADEILKAGIVDPKKVTRMALQNAASIAGLLLTTERMHSFSPQQVERNEEPQKNLLTDFAKDRDCLYRSGQQISSFKLGCHHVIDICVLPKHFPNMKSLLEIEEAIAKLPPKARRQLVQDIPALCPGEFPVDGWDAILLDPSPRPALTSLLDKLDAEYPQN